MKWISCGTEYCGGTSEERCICCGGIFSEACPCGDTGSLDACICGLKSPCLADIRPVHILRGLVGFVQQLVIAFQVRDFWWFRMAFNIGDW